MLSDGTNQQNRTNNSEAIDDRIFHPLYNVHRARRMAAETNLVSCDGQRYGINVRIISWRSQTYQIVPGSPKK
jgi:hypothetical protein